MSRARAVIRVDASIDIGSGHVMRCLTLATALRAAGMLPTFVTREHAGHLAALIERRGFDCRRLPAPSRSSDAGAGAERGHASWLGCGQDVDAAQTREALRRVGDAIDWLIVDHYALDAEWERRLRPCVRHVMVIDDLADRPHDCDVLLDQNPYPDADNRYPAFVSPSCELLLGPRYALLPPDFRVQRAVAASRQASEPYRLLVFFGGVDATGETGKFIAAWSSVRRPDLKADVLIGVANPHAETLIRMAAGVRGIRLYRHVDDMASMMARADYAFGGSGVTNWERFCIGLNCTITAVAPNQVELARHLGEIGLVDYAGDWLQTTRATYERLLRNLAPASDASRARRTRIRQQVDGSGCDRVVNRLMERE